jgi:hypothetical protein
MEVLRMRTGLVSLIALLGVLALAAQDGTNKAAAKRYGIDADLKSYPQSTAKETLGSLIKAVAAKRVDYVLAQLADPAWTDRRVKETDGGFTALVEESTGRLVGDPVTIKRLRTLSTDGEWKTDADSAVVRLKDMDEVVLFLRNGDGRWYVENRKK